VRTSGQPRQPSQHGKPPNEVRLRRLTDMLLAVVLTGSGGLWSVVQ
jgi:hypothetical protein